LNENGVVSAFHHDDSDWTIDMCLNNNFKNGNIVFKIGENENNNIKLNHEFNKMIIFKGDTLHKIEPISEGERINLIIFLKFV